MSFNGVLFLGARTYVSNDENVIEINHRLPTERAGSCAGGLWVGKFLKTHSYQKILTDYAATMVCEFGFAFYAPRLRAPRGAM